MNLVIVYGTIVTNVDFKFIYDRYGYDKDNIEKYSHVSIASCKLKLLNESVIEIYGYDNVADFMLKNLNINDNIYVEGKLDNEGRIVINTVYVVEKFHQKSQLMGWQNSPSQLTIYSKCDKI